MVNAGDGSGHQFKALSPEPWSLLPRGRLDTRYSLLACELVDAGTRRTVSDKEHITTPSFHRVAPVPYGTKEYNKAA